MLADRLAPGATVLVDDANRPAERQAVERFLAATPGATVRWVPSPKGIAVLRMP